MEFREPFLDFRLLHTVVNTHRKEFCEQYRWMRGRRRRVRSRRALIRAFPRNASANARRRYACVTVTPVGGGL